MEENFFIENPEKLKNNFFNKDNKKKFEQSFREKSKEIVKVLSMKHRHAKKISKKRQQQQFQPSSSGSNKKN